MCFATVFDVLSSFIQSLSLLSYVAYGPLDILNFLEMFTLDIVILFCCYQFQTFCFREWNGVEVDCIIKRKKTDITENNIQQAFIYFVR